MGSFNTACVISGMPIMCGEKAKLIFLRETGKMGGSMCYPQDGYSPITMPIDGVYDDYNNYTIDTDQRNYKLLLGYLRKRGVKMEEGDNKYHDIPVDPGNLDVESIFRTMHEDRLFVGDVFGRTSKVVVVAIHNTVWDKIVGIEIEDWRDKHTVASIRASLFASYEQAHSNITDLKASFENEADDIQRIKNASTVRSMAGMAMGDIFRQEGVEQMYDHQTIDYMNCEEMHVILEDLAEFRFLQLLMMVTNKVWFPTMLAGQDVDHDGVINFHQSMIDAVKQIKRDYQAEYGDDYDDDDDDE